MMATEFGACKFCGYIKTDHSPGRRASFMTDDEDDNTGAAVAEAAKAEQDAKRKQEDIAKKAAEAAEAAKAAKAAEAAEAAEAEAEAEAAEQDARRGKEKELATIDMKKAEDAKKATLRKEKQSIDTQKAASSSSMDSVAKRRGSKVPCTKYQLDMMASEFGACKFCGFVKTDHTAGRRQSFIADNDEELQEDDFTKKVTTTAIATTRTSSSTSLSATTHPEGEGPTTTLKRHETNTNDNDNSANAVMGELQSFVKEWTNKYSNVIANADASKLPMSALDDILSWSPSKTTRHLPTRPVRTTTPKKSATKVKSNTRQFLRKPAAAATTTTKSSSSTPSGKAGDFIPLPILLKKKAAGNYDGLDRLNMEIHLNDADFQAALQMDRVEFAKMPKWKRNGVKKKVGLF
jgi:hypothetical protein